MFCVGDAAVFHASFLYVTRGRAKGENASCGDLIRKGKFYHLVLILKVLNILAYRC